MRGYTILKLIVLLPDNHQHLKESVANKRFAFLCFDNQELRRRMKIPPKEEGETLLQNFTLMRQHLLS